MCGRGCGKQRSGQSGHRSDDCRHPLLHRRLPYFGPIVGSQPEPDDTPRTDRTVPGPECVSAGRDLPGSYPDRLTQVNVAMRCVAVLRYCAPPSGALRVETQESRHGHGCVPINASTVTVFTELTIVTLANCGRRGVLTSCQSVSSERVGHGGISSTRIGFGRFGGRYRTRRSDRWGSFSGRRPVCANGASPGAEYCRSTEYCSPAGQRAGATYTNRP